MILDDLVKGWNILFLWRKLEVSECSLFIFSSWRHLHLIITYIFKLYKMGRANSCHRSVGLFCQVSQFLLVKESSKYLIAPHGMKVTAPFDEQWMYPLFSVFVWQKSSCSVWELIGVVNSYANTSLLRHHETLTPLTRWGNQPLNTSCFCTVFQCWDRQGPKNH